MSEKIVSVSYEIEADAGDRWVSVARGDERSFAEKSMSRHLSLYPTVALRLVEVTSVMKTTRTVIEDTKS